LIKATEFSWRTWSCRPIG